jgi:hypothetical protein
VPGTQTANGKGGMRLSDPRTQARIDDEAAAARRAALAKLETKKNRRTGETLYVDPIAAQYAADKAEAATRRKWGQKVELPKPPNPYTHPKPAKVSAAVDAILSRYGLSDDGGMA